MSTRNDNKTDRCVYFRFVLQPRLQCIVLENISDRLFKKSTQ